MIIDGVDEHGVTNTLWDDLHELEGKALGCWCDPGLCHGQILKELLELTERPSPTMTDGEAANPGPGVHRLRRRGPRSQEALDRRMLVNHLHQQDGVFTAEEFGVWHVNMQGLVTRRKGIDELAARVRLESITPKIICVTETWLNKSISIFRLQICLL